MSHRIIHLSGVVAVAAFAFVMAALFLVRDDVAEAEPVPQVAGLSEGDVPLVMLGSSPPLDTAAYDLKLRQLAHIDADLALAPETTPPAPVPLWPVLHQPYPEAGAILPFNRIVAYYGNFYSKGMGVLGQYSREEVLKRLKAEVEKWKVADPSTPVVPAIDYIAVVAQRGAGADGKYRWRMPDKEIQKALDLAKKVDGIVILEVQAGLSDVMVEVKALEPYLSLPNVHLAIDPEFAMKKSGARPGTRVGTVDAVEVNAAAEYLAGLVKAHDLPPKIIVVHRYTQAMVTNATKITPLPEVQIVMDMDGWGSPGAKRATYQAYIHADPVQFTGFKLFYRNDVRHAGSRLLTPAEVLKLTPQPSFIQYQ